MVIVVTSRYVSDETDDVALSREIIDRRHALIKKNEQKTHDRLLLLLLVVVSH